LRNTESHGSISISEKEIDAAVHVVIDMYLFVTATNITELEMSGHYPDVADMVSINKTFVQDENIGMAADPLL
jgi:type I restriction enzyme R subunit